MDGKFQDMMRNAAMLLALAAVLALSAGCPADDTASMAQQMGAGRPGATAASQTKRGSAEPPAAEAATPDKPAEVPTADAAATAAEGDAGPYDGPSVLIENLVIKAPYPEFNGEGRYNISFKSELEEAHPAGVWQLRALNDAGVLVGSVEQFLTLSYGWKKPLDFKGLYCSEMPTKVEMWLTDKEPAKPSTVEETEQRGGAEGGGMEGGAEGGEEEGEEEGEEDGGQRGMAGLG